jgi:hypothetical protein
MFNIICFRIKFARINRTHRKPFAHQQQSADTLILSTTIQVLVPTLLFVIFASFAPARRFILIFMWFALRWRSRFVCAPPLACVLWSLRPSILRFARARNERTNRAEWRATECRSGEQHVAARIARHSTPKTEIDIPSRSFAIEHYSLIVSPSSRGRLGKWMNRGSLVYQISSSPLLACHAITSKTIYVCQ